ncbi:PREDICTED: calcitonin gene-related peptide 2-like [Hipposideros armiger]|uniref:Calcitonin gene-related peptide 2-like n=1 Tax=Hipposideros armiger TaxID=186990 RepID=A0A8B7S449_HIPAR|nr:PREDICTED: calcitonin gene-related peptide 2-like [Hipposideros armiger]
MGFWKLSPFLALGFLVLYQVGIFQAAALSSALESPEHQASLNKEKAGLLLAELIKDYLKSTAIEQEQETQGSSISAQKRACNTATYTTHRLANVLNKHGGVAKEDFEPTNVGPGSYGRRRRDVQE